MEDGEFSSLEIIRQNPEDVLGGKLYKVGIFVLFFVCLLQNCSSPQRILFRMLINKADITELFQMK